MRHDRVSNQLGVLLVLMIGLFIMAMLSACKSESLAKQESAPQGVEVPEVFYPREIPPVPPIRFMSGTEYIMVTGTPKQVHEYCAGGKDLEPGWTIFACTDMRRRIVTMPNPCLYAWEVYAALLCHEQGHVNGWQANHPE